MNQDIQIKTAQQRVIDAFRSKPQAAFSSVQASGHLDKGLVCTVRQGSYEAVMDMGKVLGGDGAGPTPGFYFRAALAGCVAIGIKMTAAREGIAVDSIDVDVEMDFDDSALLEMGNNSAAPLETRFIVTLKSPAPWGEITAMVDRALAADPFFLALRDAQKVTTRITQGAK